MTTSTQLDKLISQAGPRQSPHFYHIFEQGQSPTIKFTVVFYHKFGQLQFAGTDWKFVPYAQGWDAKKSFEDEQQLRMAAKSLVQLMMR